MSLAPGNATIETLTRGSLAEEAADAQSWVDDIVTAQRIRERYQRQCRALDLLDALGLENMTVERETGHGGRAYTYREAGSVGPVAGLLGRVGVDTRDRAPGVSHGAHICASSQTTIITAALMLLAALDVEAHGG